MALNAATVKTTSNKAVPALEAGTYPARILAIIDLGLQPQRPYQGQEKAPAQEIMITYEILDEFLEKEDGSPDESKPRVVNERFVLHNLQADRAKSTIRYKSLDPNMKHGGDFSKLIGMACNVTLVVNEGKGKNAGKQYNQVAGVAPMRAKDAAKAVELVNEPFVFDLDNPDPDEFKKMWNWIKEILVNNLEFKGSRLELLIASDPTLMEQKNASDNHPRHPQPAEPDMDEDEEDRPY